MSGYIRINLREVLARHRMNLADLHRETGIAYSSVHKIGAEKIRRLDLQHLARICQCLDCQPVDLLEYVPDGKTD